ncbi:MAG: autotransporter domain-containing protein, partial [Pseudomonadota bacterium]
GEAGVRLLHRFESGGISFRPELRLGVEQALGSQGRDMAVALAVSPGAAFIAPAIAPSKTAALVGLNLSAWTSARFELNFEARGRFSGNQTEGALQLGARLRF